MKTRPEKEQIRGIDSLQEQTETVENHPYWKVVDPSYRGTVCHVLAFSRGRTCAGIHDDHVLPHSNAAWPTTARSRPMSIPTGSRNGLGELREWSHWVEFGGRLQDGEVYDATQRGSTGMMVIVSVGNDPFADKLCFHRRPLPIRLRGILCLESNV